MMVIIMAAILVQLPLLRKCSYYCELLEHVLSSLIFIEGDEVLNTFSFSFYRFLFKIYIGAPFGPDVKYMKMVTSPDHFILRITHKCRCYFKRI